MSKHKAPRNFGGITHRGETFKAQRGFVTLPDDFPADIASAHGLKPADGDEEDLDAGGDGKGDGKGDGGKDDKGAGSSAGA